MADHHADAHTAGDAVHNATTLTHDHMDPGESFLGVHNNEEAHKHTDKVYDHDNHNNGNRHHHNRTHAKHHADSHDAKDAAYNATTATHDHTDLKESFLGVNGDREVHTHADKEARNTPAKRCTTTQMTRSTTTWTGKSMTTGTMAETRMLSAPPSQVVS